MKHFAALALVAALLPAQYSTNPAQNLAIGDRPGDQAVPKIAATRDGGCYVAWFDNAVPNYQVWLQRLDAAGVEQWPHQGILVSSNPQSTSLVDWDLITDTQDHAVLTFTDTRAGPDLDVYAYRVAPNGTMVWGANGLTLSANSDYEPSPRVCQTSDGEFVFVWSNTFTRTIQCQRADLAGVLKYPANGIAIPGDGTDTPAFCRVVAGDNGSFIVSWVRALAFSGQKHVHTQKLSAAGTNLWGASRLAVFDLASVPIAHEPRLLADGSGGAIYAWHYSAGAFFSTRVQHVSSAGVELFPHDGLEVSLQTSSKFDPAVLWLPAAQELLVFWNERNSAQSQWGIGGQKLDAAGTRLWGGNGATLLPVDTVNKLSPVAVPFAGGALVLVPETSLGQNQQRLLALRVDAGGALAWPAPLPFATAPSEKLRLGAAVSPSGVALLAWTDRRNDSGDVYAQNVNPNGTLGPQLAATLAYGCATNPAGSFLATGRAALGTTFRLSVDNPLRTQANGSASVFLVAALPDPGFPCGTSLPGFGMAGGGAQGELLVSFGGPVVPVLGPAWNGGYASVDLGVPLDLSLLGLALHAQGAIVDPTPSAFAPIGLARAARVTVGF